MAESKLDRGEVQNPFEQRLPQVNRQMAQPSKMPRAAFQKADNASFIVEALSNFAGVGAAVYTSVQNKKIEADKVIQTGRALLNKTPSDDATLAGYRTHAAVTLNAKILKSQARLNELAKSGIEDEAWDESVKDEYSKVDALMEESYKGYKTDKEMQKLVTLSFREMMPQLVSARESDRINREIEARVNDASDILISSTRLANSEGASLDPEAIVYKIDQAVKGLQLTSAQKDQVILKAILATESPALIEASKHWRGDRKTSLYEREGTIQKLQEQIDDQEISNNAVSLATELGAYKDGILSGDLTLKNGLALIDKRNKQLDGKFASRGAVTDIIYDYRKSIAADYKMRQVVELLGDQSQTDAEQFTPEERQAGYKKIYADMSAQAESAAAKLPKDQQEAFITNNLRSTVSKVSDMAVTKDDVVEPFVKSFANLASSNVVARQQTNPDGSYSLDSTTKQAIVLLDSMSPIAQFKHLEAVGGKEAKTIRAFMAYRDRGMDDPQALVQAQSFMTNPYPTDLKRVRKGVSAVRNNLEFSWFKADFDNNQEAYLEAEIQNQIELSPEPDDDSNVKLVTEYFNKGWTTAGSLRLKGTPGYLSRSMGINVDKLESTMKAFIWSQKDVWRPQLEALGLDEDDVFPIIDNKRGTIRITARNKAMNANHHIGNPIPLSRVRDLAASYKVAKEKEADTLKNFEIDKSKRHKFFEWNPKTVTVTKKISR